MRFSAEAPSFIGGDRLFDQIIAQNEVCGDQIGRIPPIVPEPFVDLSGDRVA